MWFADKYDVQPNPVIRQSALRKKNKANRLKQIPFKYYKEFIDSTDEKFLIEAYSVTGGVPKYIEMFESNDDIYTAIKILF